MRTKRGDTEGFKFISSFDKFIEPLHLEGKITNPDRSSFMRDYLGLHPVSWKYFTNSGIKKIYK